MRPNPRAVFSALAGFALIATSVLVGAAPATASGGHHHHHHHHHYCRTAVVGFASSSYIQQAGEQVEVTIQTNRALSRPTSIRVTSEAVTSRPDIDFVPVNTRVTIPAGARSATLVIQTLQPDAGISPNTFVLRLSRPSSGLRVGAQAQTTITVERFDLPPLDPDSVTSAQAR